MAAKTDMERLGYFSEQSYITIGDPYVPPNIKPFNEKASKGRQMMIGSTKTKTALQVGYFSEKFSRIMGGESYSDAVKRRRQDRQKEAKKNLTKDWVPSSVPKKPSGMGSHYGTLGGSVDAFSPVKNPPEKYQQPKRNFLTNPGKRGTGFGYVGVTFGPDLKQQSEPYNRAKELRKKEEQLSKKSVKGTGPFKLNTHPNDLFEDNPFRSNKTVPPAKDATPDVDKLTPFKPSHPAKKEGGCKAGTFDPYPKHSEEPYQTPKNLSVGVRPSVGKGKPLGGVFRPPPGPKSTPVSSIMEQNVHKMVNSSNYLTMSSSTS